VKVAAAGLIGSLLLLAVRVFSAWQGWGILGLSAAVAIEGLGILMMGAILFRGYPIARPSLVLLRDYTAYAWPQMALIAITSLTADADRAMLGRLAGAAQVGYYVAVLGVLAVATEMVRTVMSLFFPRVSRDAELADYASMYNRLKGALKYLLLIIIPLVGAVMLMRDWWVPSYLGVDFVGAAPVAAVLALTVIPVTISRPYQQVLFAVEQHSHLLGVRLLGLLVLIAAGALLIPRSLFGLPGAGLGAVGAALALLLKDSIECACIVGLCNRYVGIGFWSKALWYIVAGTVQVGAGSAILAQLPQPGMVIVLGAVAVGLASYLLVLYAVGQFRKAEATLLLDTIHPVKLLRYIRSELNTIGQDARGYLDDVDSGLE
jgi:O-antigen/teichoic acid export membrane protein